MRSLTREQLDNLQRTNHELTQVRSPHARG